VDTNAAATPDRRDQPPAPDSPSMRILHDVVAQSPTQFPATSLVVQMTGAPVPSPAAHVLEAGYYRFTPVDSAPAPQAVAQGAAGAQPTSTAVVPSPAPHILNAGYYQFKPVDSAPAQKPAAPEAAGAQTAAVPRPAAHVLDAGYYRFPQKDQPKAEEIASAAGVTVAVSSPGSEPNAAPANPPPEDAAAHQPDQDHKEFAPGSFEYEDARDPAAGATKSRPPPRQQQESGTWLRLTDEARNARDPSEASVQIQSWYRGHLGRAYAAELKAQAAFLEYQQDKMMEESFPAPAMNIENERERLMAELTFVRQWVTPMADTEDISSLTVYSLQRCVEEAYIELMAELEYTEYFKREQIIGSERVATHFQLLFSMVQLEEMETRRLILDWAEECGPLPTDSSVDLEALFLWNLEATKIQKTWRGHRARWAVATMKQTDARREHSENLQWGRDMQRQILQADMQQRPPPKRFAASYPAATASYPTAAASYPAAAARPPYLYAQAAASVPPAYPSASQSFGPPQVNPPMYSYAPLHPAPAFYPDISAWQAMSVSGF